VNDLDRNTVKRLIQIPFEIVITLDSSANTKRVK
jgi:hypothetical protein